ncbi:hypothetical protein AB9R81_18120 [Vibrio cyclitrophicus]|uniref:hypothetical protein n=1 Tax=Vibrio cyclitrophicus TaxID=47951 RepID=UPI000C83E5CA|nr:hypothetical protein [Vibrio cyclitrophicus]PMJ42484.1 hypothetical protein BCU24_08115 [Vibrio cyclitrophicus]
MEFNNISTTVLRKRVGYSYHSENLHDWSAPWLLNDFTEPVWKIDTGQEKPQSLYFDTFIPATNEQLINSKYRKILNTIKKIIFLSRIGILETESTSTDKISRIDSIRGCLSSFKALTLFLFKIYPEEMVIESGFSLLTTADIKQFNIDIAIGRADQASGLINCIEKKLSCINIEQIKKLLDLDDITNGRKFSIQNLLKKLSIDKYVVSEATSKRIIELLIELFPEISTLISTRKKSERTEYPNSCPPKISNDSKTGQTTFNTLTIALTLLENYSMYLPELNNYSNQPMEVTEDFIERYLKPKKRTPNIPTDIALHYLNAAIKLISVYGEGIIEAKKVCEMQLMKIHKNNPKFKRDYILSDRCSSKINLPLNNFTRDYNVTRYNELNTSVELHELRTDVTVLYGYKMLMAATYILIHTFCIKRVSENVELKDSSLEHGLWGGYELFFGIRKTLPTENSFLVTGRPIPNIVFEGFNLLIEANEHFYNEQEDIYIFPKKYTTNRKGNLPNNQPMTAKSMINMLKAFGDFIDVPTTLTNGIRSRFYLSRTHVMRRFGARAFYALTDISDFPALTWLMGHNSTEETWHYLLEEVGSEELTEEEAISVLDAIYKPNIDTSRIETAISEDVGMMFNNVSKDVALDYIQSQISNGAKVYNYKDETGKTIIYMEIVDD